MVTPPHLPATPPRPRAARAPRWLRRALGARQGGFTMIEVLITMLLLTVVLLGLAALQITTIRQVSLSNRANGALRLCQSVIERYQNQTFSLLPSTASTDWEPVFKKDGTTPMTLVGEDGESDGPYTVQQFIELTNDNGDKLITARATWLDAVQSNDSDPTKSYRTLEVLLTIRRTTF